MSMMNPKQEYKICKMFNNNVNGVNEDDLFAVYVTYYGPESAEIHLAIDSERVPCIHKPIHPSDFGLKQFIPIKKG